MHCTASCHRGPLMLLHIATFVLRHLPGHLSTWWRSRVDDLAFAPMYVNHLEQPCKWSRLFSVRIPEYEVRGGCTPARDPQHRRLRPLVVLNKVASRPGTWKVKTPKYHRATRGAENSCLKLDAVWILNWCRKGRADQDWHCVLTGFSRS